MREVVMLNRVSIDGFFAGPNGEIDWFIHDPEVDKAAHKRGRQTQSYLGAQRISCLKAFGQKLQLTRKPPKKHGIQPKNYPR